METPEENNNLLVALRAGKLAYTKENAEKVQEEYVDSTVFNRAIESIGLNGLPDPGGDCGNAPEDCENWLIGAMLEADKIRGGKIRESDECLGLLRQIREQCIAEFYRDEQPSSVIGAIWAAFHIVKN